ncbi:MAG TPA: serine protease, partial [Mycobacterium sp.]|nr:serine protease [Mycobacterium sp.]
MSSDKDSSGGAHRLAPRPISRPPVDPAASRAFGRPKGVDGSFVAEDLRPAKFRDEDVFRATDAKADPVLQEAFGRPATAAERAPVVIDWADDDDFQPGDDD